ncbi:beta-hexosaminidase [Mesorhizobium sp. 131-3-5]|uniref:glycoside hydrolase family 3 protein n=1 Tax=Mesorhizobium sp. 131-3-5 TaxID=2744520 RepID=UPI001926A118|nr:glycoside hydrolase family 3 protein [Mesorhizobium sp. 131-3-5]BCH08391.1 beta-hexosaminidase [Mesorhizobium sp. 131-3-5]
MTFTITEDARAVLLPAFDGTLLSDATKRFLDGGGISLLLGESRDEYLARRMSDSRRNSETAETLQRVTDAARARSGMLLAAVDQEMGGTCRLHDLVPQFPALRDLPFASEEEIAEISKLIATGASSMGINVFLSPVVDVLTGPNKWLEGRTWSNNAELVATLSAAYIRGVQSGRVAATAKHFPGYSTTTGDPAVDENAINPLALSDVEAGLAPFRAAIAAGVEMIMVGPAIVMAYDHAKAALRSQTVVQVLKKTLGFDGIVMADDLDSMATMRGDSVAAVAIDALNAGCDFLLLADTGTQLDEIADAIETAARSETISAEALAKSATKVRRLSRKYEAQSCHSAEGKCDQRVAGSAS